MASVLDQRNTSNLSLQGNRFNPRPSLADWGYPDATGQLQPNLSKLHLTYSVDGIPNVRIQDYNRAALGGVTTVRPPSLLDELDPNAPKNTQVGPSLPGPYGVGKGPVVSQIYKSPTGQRYRDLGPSEGRY